MFTRHDLSSELSELAERSSPPLEVVHFDELAFTSPDSEESIWSIRGTKAHFSNAMMFWVKSLQAQDWVSRADYFHPYVEQSKCTPLTEEQFFSLISGYSGRLGPPLPAFLRRRNGFVAALQMYGDWNDVAALAEFLDEYVAFFWSTTA